MAYKYSDVERANASWFDKDATRQSLKAIEVNIGTVRGLANCKIEFSYPISAIAGKNGSGKSTLLALAACAFHGSASGWRLPDRKHSYYTFSEFFIQAAEDVPIDGIEIEYTIHHDNWLPDEELPDGVGIGSQTRFKSKGGKWNDYDGRVRRPVAFLGIERVVPPAERSVFKSYRYSFGSSEKSGWEERVRDSVSRVLGAPYADFEIKSHGKYRLPVVRRHGHRYSGFNMGAGEKALFEVFAAIFAAPSGTLFLIDEIEIGLHEAAQRSLIEELSRLCVAKKIQIICTTHAPAVLAALPPEGRFLIQSGSVTQITTGVSPAFAAGRMSNANSAEMTVYVEDGTARLLVEAFVGHSLRRRIRILPIGSHSAVVHQLAARYIEGIEGGCIAILDGDQTPGYAAHFRKFLGYLGERSSDAAKKWGEARLRLLPGSIAPEHWVFTNLRGVPHSGIEKMFPDVDADTLLEAIDAALLADAHSATYEFCRVLGIEGDERTAWRDCCRILAAEHPHLLDEVVDVIKSLLKG